MGKETLKDKIMRLTVDKIEWFFAERWLNKTFGRQEFWGDHIMELKRGKINEIKK